MPNVYVGIRDKNVGFKVSKEVREAMQKRANYLGYTKITDYILTLIAKDFKEAGIDE